MNFVLALTIGLLAFLVVDMWKEAHGTALAAVGALDAPVVIPLVALLTMELLFVIGHSLQRRMHNQNPRAAVQRVSDRDPERLRYLEELGIRPGVTIRVVEVLPFDGPLRLEVSGIKHVIGGPLAAVVQVTPGEGAA